jgi:hypothetical protein
VREANRGRALGLLLGLSSLLGCAVRPYYCPKEGGPRWIEVTSAHFVMRTDLEPAAAEALLRADEETLGRFEQVADFLLPPAPVESQPTQLIVMATLKEYQQLARPEDAGAYFIQVGATTTDERGRPLIRLSGDSSTGDTFRHELAHRVMNERVAQAPTWVKEGLAEYFSNLPVLDDKIVLGARPRRLQGRVVSARYHTIQYGAPNPAYVGRALGELLGLSSQRPVDLGDGGYFLAWAAVHYLANGAPDYPERFRAYLADLSDGRSSVEALAKHYAALPAIEEAVWQHLDQATGKKTQQWFLRYHPIVVTGDADVRPLNDAEVHHLYAALRPEREQPELDRARLHDPESPELHLWVGDHALRSGDQVVAEAELVRALDLRPDDPFYRFEHARMKFLRELGRPPAQRQPAELDAEMHALARTAHTPQAMELLAAYYRLAGQTTLGETFAARAESLDARCPTCLSLLASFQLARGANDESAATQKLALRRWPDEPAPVESEAVLQRYRCMQQPRTPRCKR